MKYAKQAVGLLRLEQLLFVRWKQLAQNLMVKFRLTVAGPDIFITPGYQFKVVEAFSTNFHLPKSTLVMLVSAFAGKDLTLAAYQHAIEEKYRFFSFGDAMFIK